MFILDYIGYNSSIILTIIGIYQLQHQKIYLLGFILGSILDVCLNKILKLLFKQKRPNDPILFTGIETTTTYLEEEQYGMPSEHAQTLFFALTFLYLVKKSMTLLILSLFLGGLTIYQRLKYLRHTIEQLCIGSIIGILFAIIWYNGVNRYLSKNSFIE